MSDAELDALQARHLAYRAELGRRGVVVVNGPFDEQSDRPDGRPRRRFPSRRPFPPDQGRRAYSSMTMPDLG
jgi:hypothetical protein